MRLPLSIINAFLEDSCVIVMIAYLLARGRMLSLLVSERLIRRQAMLLGVVLGLAALTEVIFPGARAPYLAHSLLITFATLTGGAWVGTIASVVVFSGEAIFRAPPGVLETALTLFASVAMALIVRRATLGWNRLVRAAFAGLAAQTAVVVVHSLPISNVHPPHMLAHSLITIAANSFGLFLLQLILDEAWTRAESEKNRSEFERSQTLMAQAQLAALRARVHPNFLVNSLSSIAELCRNSPTEAENTVLRLGRLMRWALEAEPSAQVRLAEEIAIVRDYLEIEQHRLGSRLKVVWEVDEKCMKTHVPSSSLQSLVENAIVHGVAPGIDPSEVRIVVRRCRGRVVVRVQDTGVGMPARVLETVRQGQGKQQGCAIVNGHLQLLYGPKHRLRMWSRADKGTLAVFSVPTGALGGQDHDSVKSCDRRRAVRTHA